MFQAHYQQLAGSGMAVAELHAIIRRDADILAAGVDQLGQRSIVYHRIYRDSGRVFHFPLVASHGALWARWYLLCAHVAAFVLAGADVTCRLSYREKMGAFTGYLRAIKEINRQVMIEAYTCLYLYLCFGDRACAEFKFSDKLATQFRERFGAGAAWKAQAATDRDFYETFFRWEQDKVVGPAVDAALATFNWPLMRVLARRPWVWFSYFRIGRALVFRDFSDREERVAKGLAAFDWAAVKGWNLIERNARRNPFLPRRLEGLDRVHSSGSASAAIPARSAGKAA